MPLRPKSTEILPVSDPDSVPEIFCDGQFSIIPGANFATLTFTHVRPKPGPLIATGKVEKEAVIRARIVLSRSNLVALRDALNQLLREELLLNTKCPRRQNEVKE